MSTADSVDGLTRPIVFVLTRAEVIRIRWELRKRVYGGYNPFIVIAIWCTLLTVQPALRFTRYGFRDVVSWALCAFELTAIAIALGIGLALRYARLRRMSVKIDDAGLIVVGCSVRPLRPRYIPWAKIRAVHILDEAFVITTRLGTLTIPIRVLNDASALEAFFEEKLVGKKWLLLGSASRRIITNTAAR